MDVVGSFTGLLRLKIGSCLALYTNLSGNNAVALAAKNPTLRVPVWRALSRCSLKDVNYLEG